MVTASINRIRRLPPIVPDGAVAIVLMVSAGLAEFQDAGALSVVQVVAIVCITLPLTARRMFPTMVSAVIGTELILHLLAGFSNSFVENFAILLALYTVYASARSGWRIVVMSAALVIGLCAGITLGWRSQHHVYLSDIGYNAIIFTLPVILGYGVRTRRAYVAQLQEQSKLLAWTRRRAGWLRPVTAIALVLQAGVLLPIALPIVPEAVMARSTLASIRTDFADTIGWQDLVAEVAAVYRDLPAPRRSSAVLLADNYGEAGAINTYGPALRLPTAVSGELTYYYWRPATLDGPVISVGLDPAFLATLFDGCAQVATVSNSYGLQNQEAGVPIVVCSAPRLPLNELWPHLKSFQ